MIKSLTLNELLTVVAGRSDASQLSQDITRVSTDTRTLGLGSLYVPLKGERFDGHAFAQQAKAAGAVAMLAEQPLTPELLATSEFPVIYVDSTLRALADLAAWHRDQFDGAVVAVTGSAGKTTVKNLMGSVLSQAFNTLITQGNLNNHIGAPLTLLSLEPEHQAAMIELGASGLGEIEYTARLARPQVGILTNVVPAHLEGFGSVDNIARTKGEIIDCTDLNGTVILNVDDVYFPQWQARAGQRRITTFGFSEAADVRAINIEETVAGCRFTCVSPDFTADISLTLPGRHNVRNALAVIAAAQALNLTQSAIVTGLESARPVAGRLQACAGRRGETLLNDAYNANPESFKAAIDVLTLAAGRKVLVMGDMGELGDTASAMHAEVGQYAANKHIDALYATGELSRAAIDAFGEGAQWFENRQALIEFLLQHTLAGDTLLVKGSRSAGMDQVIHALEQEEEEN